MEPTMNAALDGISKSGIRVFTQMAKQEPGCLFLTLGEPDFDTPASIREAAKASLDAGDTHYPENNGQPFLRQAIARFEQEKHGLSYAPDEIIVTVGATEALFCALFGILNPGDEVIVPTPAFGLYEAIIKLCRGVCVPLDTRADGFQIRPAALQAALSPRTKAIILTSPNNPTGCIYDHESLTAVYAAAKEHPIFVLCDEVYRDLIYTDAFESFHQFSDLRSRIIEVQSFSKPYAMTGWRLGYCMADTPIRDRMQIFHQHAVVSAPSYVQPACVQALKTDVSGVRELFRRRRDEVYRRLTDMGLEVQKPEGAFYMFINIEKYGMASEAFCTKMLQEGLVGLIPGVYFGTEGYMRLSYCYSDEDLKEGLDRIEKFLQTV